MSLDALQDAIRHLHGCESRWVESVPIADKWLGEVVWTGEVEVFDLIDCPEAPRCYAWSHAVDDSDRRRFVVVLHKGPIQNALSAVQASIAAQHGKG